MTHYAKRKDNNHNEITAALVAAGATVADLSRLGDGAPDILVYTGLWTPIEIKSRNGQLTDDEETWWRKMGLAPILARSPAEAFAVCSLSPNPAQLQASANGPTARTGRRVRGGLREE